MSYDFDSLVNRHNLGNIKDIYRPSAIKARDYISFAGAEFDFKTAPSVIEAIVLCAQNGLLGYTACTSSYLERITWWMKKARSFEVKPQWIVATNGTIFSLATALRAFTAPGEGMIMFTPEYHRYKSTAIRNRRSVVPCPLIQNRLSYQIDFDLLEALMKRDHNKLLVFSNPANPIGRVWSSDELAQIAAIAAKHDVMVFSDEIFAEITFEGRRTTPFLEVADDKQPCLVSTSLGKAFSLTGVNQANIIIANDATRVAFTAQRDTDHFGSIDPLFHAAMHGAYNSDGLDWLNEMIAYVYANYLFLKNWLEEHLPKVFVFDLEGTYVAWIDFSGLELIDSDLTYLLEQRAFLHMDGGDSYGSTAQFRRMNLATPRWVLADALDRLHKVVHHA